MRRFLLTAVLCALSARADAGRRYAAMSDADRTAAIATARAIPSLAERLAAISAPFLDTPYGISPLGEGSGIDPDPRLRWDSVDCLTFVETTLALAAAPSADHLLNILDDIRYSDGKPAFEHRNHFVEAQWVPRNRAKGYLRPISREIAGADAVTITTDFSLKRWHERTGAEELSSLPDSIIPQGKFSLDVVPIAFAAAHPERIPNGTLLFVVRVDSWHAPTRVSHVGFVFEKDGRKVLRHASKEPFDRVVDEPLSSFFGRNEKYDKRPVVGFSLYEVREPLDRVAKLTHER